MSQQLPADQLREEIMNIELFKRNGSQLGSIVTAQDVNAIMAAVKDHVDYVLDIEASPDTTPKELLQTLRNRAGAY